MQQGVLQIHRHIIKYARTTTEVCTEAVAGAGGGPQGDSQVSSQRPQRTEGGMRESPELGSLLSVCGQAYLTSLAFLTYLFPKSLGYRKWLMGPVSRKRQGREEGRKGNVATQHPDCVRADRRHPGDETRVSHPSLFEGVYPEVPSAGWLSGVWVFYFFCFY